jgi:hypothetical protein
LVPNEVTSDNPRYERRRALDVQFEFSTTINIGTSYSPICPACGLVTRDKTCSEWRRSRYLFLFNLEGLCPRFSRDCKQIPKNNKSYGKHLSINKNLPNIANWSKLCVGYENVCRTIGGGKITAANRCVVVAIQEKMKPVKQFSGCQVCWPISSHGFVRFLT